MPFYGKYVAAALAAALTSGASLPAADVPVSAAAKPAAASAPQAPSASSAVAAAATPAQIVIPRMAPIVEPGDLEPQDEAVAASTDDIDPELECLAKVVLHEAGNQSRTGQIAVAEVVMNRVRSPRFPNTICGVVMQRGQFFNVHAYRAERDSRWPRAVSIARSVRDGNEDSVTNGAFFFRAHYGASFPGRTRVATIGDHAFYR